jgi:hypothetical protein
MDNLGFIKLLNRIAENKDGKDLNHYEVATLAYGLISTLPDVNGIDCYIYSEIELFLTMMTKKGVPHHAKCYFAKQCLAIFEKGDRLKKSEIPTPGQENF